MKKEFTKKDLKNGMIAEYRDGERAIFLGGELIGLGDWMNLKFYEDDLTYRNNKSCDIVRVYELNDFIDINRFKDLEKIYKTTDMLEVIWEREEKPKYTMEELKAIVGHDFDILF